MNPMPEIIPMLKQLRLSGILDSLETRNRQAIDEKFSYMDFLATVITDEIARRSQKKLASALRRANFRNQKTLEEFDFTFNPTINRVLITELACSLLPSSPTSDPTAYLRSPVIRPFTISADSCIDLPGTSRSR